MNTLPWEVIEIILSKVPESLITYHNLSLTCKSFRTFVFKEDWREFLLKNVIKVVADDLQDKWIDSSFMRERGQYLIKIDYPPTYRQYAYAGNIIAIMSYHIIYGVSIEIKASLLLMYEMSPFDWFRYKIGFHKDYILKSDIEHFVKKLLSTGYHAFLSIYYNNNEIGHFDF